MILNLFLVIDLCENYEPLPKNIHTKHLHDILSLLSTLPSQGHSWTPDYEALIFYVSVIDHPKFIFMTTLYGRFCYPHHTAEENGPH